MALTDMVPTPGRDSMNTGLSSASHATMIEIFGVPGKMTVDCSEPTNPKVLHLVETKSVGPFKVTGIKPAVESLADVFADVKAENAELYAILGTAGMLCCRAVRGSKIHFSNHSWGTAIDMTIHKILSPMDAEKVPQGLVDLYPYFHKHGWFWAAGYKGRTDPMHFEVAQETIEDWRAKGLI